MGIHVSSFIAYGCKITDLGEEAQDWMYTHGEIPYEISEEIELKYYGCLDDAERLLVVSESIIHNTLGDISNIDSDHLHSWAGWDRLLTDFAKEHGIEIEDPSWKLCTCMS
jgi:hypothetical protein